MKAQSVLYNHAILLNWENETTSYNSIFQSWIPPSQPILTSLPIWTHPLKIKKTQTPSIFFENQKCPSHSLGGGEHHDTSITMCFLYLSKLYEFCSHYLEIKESNRPQ